MAAEQTHIYRKKIKETDFYKSLSFIQRKSVTTRNNCKAIEHHLNVIKNTNYKDWFLNQKPCKRNQIIIDQILINDQ